MLKGKKKLSEMADEIVRCEKILQDENSSDSDKERAEWKMSAIFSLYENDIEAIFLLLSLIENKMT